MSWKDILKEEKKVEGFYNPELARLNQRMNKLQTEYDRLTAMNTNKKPSSDLNNKLEKLSTEITHIKEKIARAEKIQASSSFIDKPPLEWEDVSNLFD